MSVLERRLQLLLSHEQHARLAREAARSGRSVNAVVRDAIDLALPGPDSSWQDGLTAFLDMSAEPPHEVVLTPRQLAAELDAEFAHTVSPALT